MSLISTAVIGIPSFVLALEPNHERIRGNFLANVLARSLPASLAIVCALFAELALGRLLDHSFAEISTVCMMITVVIGLALIYRISRPLTLLRSTLLVAMSGLVLLSYTVFGEFFRVVRLAPDVAVFTVVLAALSITLFEWTSRIFLASYEQSALFARVVRFVEGKDGE